jgi:Outer membrane protein beta-barrel domain
MRYVLVMVLAIAVVPAGGAQPASAYYGLAYGSFDYSEDDGLGNEIVTDTTDSYRLMVGYQFNEHLAFEGGWGKTSSIVDSTAFDAGPPFGIVAIDFHSDIEILTVRFLGVLPFDSGITMLGGLGYADMKQDVTIDYIGFGQQSYDVDGGEVTYFAGVQYDWERVALRLGYEKYDMGNGVDIAETSLAFFYKL